ncbi:MAG: hypothetical protein K5866_06300 [Treponema sp.]|nr:hypothetical protein [Treponema sp.]
MKTIHEEFRNLTIEEITKLEADTIGLSFFSKESPVAFREDESVTKYQNLLSGNDRTVNRELFVHFEGRQRDILEYIVKKIIPSGQSLFMASQTDKGIKDFIEKNDKRNLQVINYGSKQNEVPDYKTKSTDWINYFSYVDYGELPESLSEDVFINSVYQIFSYQILPLRLKYHKENEDKKELSEICDKVKNLIRIRLIDFSYPAKINELIQFPSDLNQLKKDFKKEFKEEIFQTYQDLADTIYYLFDFYSHLCQRINDYEISKKEKIKENKWSEIFRKSCYHQKWSNGEEKSEKNEAFWEALEVLRSPKIFTKIKENFKDSDADSLSILSDYELNGTRGLLQKIQWQNGAKNNSFFIAFVNGLIGLTNSIKSNGEKIEQISDLEKMEDALKNLWERNGYNNANFSSFNDEEKALSNALSEISSTLKSFAEKYKEALNTRMWFDFMKSLVNDSAFIMKEEAKTKSFIAFENETLKDDFSNSAFNDFVAQITGVFENKGFLTCIDLCLENLEIAKKSAVEEKITEDCDKYSYYKTSFDFIEKAFIEIRKKVLDFKIKREDEAFSLSWKHSCWSRFLDCLREPSLNLEKIPSRIDDWYFDEESGKSKRKFDGKNTFKPINLWDFTQVLNKCLTGLPKTVVTIIYDIFHLNDNYTFNNSNSLLDKYEYSGLMEKNPFAHSIVSAFYKFLYDFFMYLRSNITNLIPRGLSQKQILEYSLNLYIAKKIINPDEFDYSLQKSIVDQEIKRNFTLVKHFVKRYFEKKGSLYKPSMKCANIDLKREIEALGLDGKDSFSKLAYFIDTKHKSKDIKSNPSASAYVFNCIISDDSYFPREVSNKTIKKYRSDYFNYYLLCNFYKAVSPYFEDDTEKIISKIVEGILAYTFYSPKEYKVNPVNNAFDYLLRQDLKNSHSYDLCFWEEYFWYSEEKDDRLLKKLRHYNSNLVKEAFWRMREKFPEYYRQEKKYIDVDLEEKFAEFIRDELADNTGDFYYYYYRAKVEYYKYIQGQESNGLNAVVSYFEKAFKNIYFAGNFASLFISDLFELYSPIQEAKKIYEWKKTSLKQLEDCKKYSSSAPEEYYESRKKEIEEEFERQKKWVKDRYGLDISKSSTKEISLKPLKEIWQWAEAAGIVGKSFSHIKEKMDGNIRGGVFWSQDFYKNDNSQKVKNNYELLIQELEKEETTIYLQYV